MMGNSKEHRLNGRNEYSFARQYLFEKAITELETNGFENLEFIIKLLKDSSCLENHEASFVLSVIYLHGIGVKADSDLVVNWIPHEIYRNLIQNMTQIN